jgi:hypothetical protein
MRHDFEERRERRINNAKNRAVKNTEEAKRLFKRSDEMASFIPPGQPILIGHHSEKGDRRYREKMRSTFSKGIESDKKAEYYAEKADSIESNNAIFSDDPEALQKLTEQLNNLKEVQEFMKAANKCIKKQDKEAFLKLAYGTPERWEEINTSHYIHGKGYPRYRLTNNGANIRRIEQRINQLKVQATKTITDKVVNGVRIFENTGANRLQLIFDCKPSAEVRQLLKAHGFRWSPTEGAWQRHISRQALYSAESIAERLSN